MTAYAGADYSVGDIAVSVEIRGYNSRNLDVALKLYHRYGFLEDRIRKTLAHKIARGRVEVKLTISETPADAEIFRINESMAKAYYDTLDRLKSICRSDETIPLALIAGKPGIIETADPEVNADSLWAAVAPCLESALETFDAMKRTEGAALKADLDQRLYFIEDSIRRISDKAGDMVSLYQEKLKTRIAALTQGMVDIDPARIAQEAAFITDRSDISEELVRADSHLSQFRQLMADPEPSGRPLNFLLQEFNREFNTMGSKAGDTDIAYIIVSVKTELEKIREQIQNVE